MIWHLHLHHFFSYPKSSPKQNHFSRLLFTRASNRYKSFALILPHVCGEAPGVNFRCTTRNDSMIAALRFCLETPVWDHVDLKSIPQKFNIDTKNGHIWLEPPFPNNHFGYPAVSFRGRKTIPTSSNKKDRSAYFFGSFCVPIASATLTSLKMPGDASPFKSRGSVSGPLEMPSDNCLMSHKKRSVNMWMCF